MEKKDTAISIIRLISMIMIISCHILQGLNNKWAFWINVGVQIFFFLSGFLYGKKDIINTKEFYINRVKKILVPYMILCLVSIFLELVILKNSYTISFIIGSFLGFGGFNGNFSIISHTWFISYILLCYLIVPVLQLIFKNKKYKNNIIKFIFLLIFIQLLQGFSVLSIDACWINNFIIGYYYSRCCNDKKSKKVFEITTLILSILIIPLAVIYQESLKISLPIFLNTNSSLIMQYGHILLAVIIFIVLYKVFSIINIKYSFVLKLSDNYSYYIYLVHQIFILFSFSVLFLTKYLIINILLIIILSIFFAIILKYITDYILSIMKKIRDVKK